MKTEVLLIVFVAFIRCQASFYSGKSNYGGGFGYGFPTPKYGYGSGKSSYGYGTSTGLGYNGYNSYVGAKTIYSYPLYIDGYGLTYNGYSNSYGLFDPRYGSGYTNKVYYGLPLNYGYAPSIGFFGKYGYPFKKR